MLHRHGRKPVSAEETRDLIGKGPRTLMERAWMLTGHPADEEEVRNLHSDIDYSLLKEKLLKISENVVPGYDGLKIVI